MGSSFILVSIFEIAVVAFIIYGLMNEEKFAEYERKVFSSIARLIKRRIARRSFQKQ